MREILFRGKHMANGQWCEGNLAVRKNGIAIITPDDTPCGVYGQVRPDTVGQYTGLTDRNGKKIFDGDIVKHFNNDSDPEKFDTGVILWNQHACQWERTSSGQSKHYKIGAHCKYEVIDNIHDNPELLKERNNA